MGKKEYLKMQKRFLKRKKKKNAGLTVMKVQMPFALILAVGFSILQQKQKEKNCLLLIKNGELFLQLIVS